MGQSLTHIIGNGINTRGNDRTWVRRGRK